MLVKRLDPASMWSRATEALEAALLDMMLAFFVWQTFNSESATLEEAWSAFLKSLPEPPSEVVAGMVWEAIEGWAGGEA